MIHVVVVEDEAHSRQLLVGYLKELPGIEVVGEAGNGAEGLAVISRLKPDAVFLDIEMPGLKGIDLARALPEPRARIVFVTAHAEHAVDAFKLGAVHYLLKPVSLADIAQALSRLYPPEEPLQREWLRLPVRRKESLRLIDPREVDALVADLGDCLAWTAEGRLRVEGTLAHWEARLESLGFKRVHRNALVRLSAIQELREDGEIRLPSGALSVSRRRLEELHQCLGI